MLIAEILNKPVDEYATLPTGMALMSQDDLGDLQRIKNRLKLVDTPVSDMFEVRYRKSGKYHEYVLFDKKIPQAVGLFALEPGYTESSIVKPGVKVVTPHLSLNKDYQGQGIGSRIYSSFLDQGTFVYSTWEHTKAAKALWDSLSNQPGMISFYYDEIDRIAAYFPFSGDIKELAVRFLGRKDLFKKFPIYKDKKEYNKAIKQLDMEYYS